MCDNDLHIAATETVSMNNFDDIIRLLYLGIGIAFLVLGVVFIIIAATLSDFRLPNVVGGFLMVAVGGGLVYFRLRRGSASD